MNDTDERLAYLEGRIEEQTHMLNGIREAMGSLEARMDRRFEQLEARLDQRFAAIDQRFAVVDQRFLGIDERLGRMELMLWGLIAAFVSTGVGVLTVAILR